MTSRERLLAAMNNEKPDRLPATVHSWMDYFLNRYLNGIDQYSAYTCMGLDMVIYDSAYRDGIEGAMFWQNKEMMKTKKWQVRKNLIEKQDDSYRYKLEIMTPSKTLTMVLEGNEATTWITENLIKEKEDIYILEKYMPYPEVDIHGVNKIADKIGDRGILRSHVYGYGQPGCWQDACCFFGTTNMIYATYDDPEWVHEFLSILLKKKLDWVYRLEGARFDLLELGGGDASDTVISPKLFDEFVLPYDRQIVNALHEVALKCVYHTCGGMMKILDQIKATGADGSETLTPPGMGGNARLEIIKEKLGKTMFLQGGFDQLHGFIQCPVETTKKMVFECFEKAGKDGGYVLCPSDHFFDADVANLKAFSDAAKECTY